MITVIDSPSVCGCCNFDLKIWLVLAFCCCPAVQSNQCWGLAVLSTCDVNCKTLTISA